MHEALSLEVIIDGREDAPGLGDDERGELIAAKLPALEALDEASLRDALQRLAKEGRATMLEAVKIGAAPKKIKKLAGKLLFGLASKGIKASAFVIPSGKPSKQAPSPADKGLGFLSSVDGSGQYMAAVAVPEPDGLYFYLEAVVDTRGVVTKADAGHMRSKRAIRDEATGEVTDPTHRVNEVPVGLAAKCLDDAITAMRGQGKSLPRYLAQNLRTVTELRSSHPATIAAGIATLLGDLGDVTPAPVDALAAHPLGRFVPEEVYREMKASQGRIAELLSSPLAVDERQRSQWIDEVLDTTAATVFEGPLRRVFADFYLVQAVSFWRMGEPALAKAAFEVGATMADEGLSIAGVPFCREYLRVLFDIDGFLGQIAERKAAEEAEPSLIV